MRGLRKTVGVLVGAALVLSACTGSEPGPDDGGGDETATSDDGDATPVDDGQLPSANIATLLTRTGFAAVFGESQQAGVELAVEHLADEGIADLQLVASEDVGDSNSTALNAYRRVAGQDVVALVGPIVGPMILAMRPDLDRDEIPLVVSAATRSLTLDDNVWIYRSFPHSGMSATANAIQAFDEIGVERPAILADNTAFGQDDAAVLIEEAGDRGIDIVANESVDPEAVDVTGQVSRIINADADAVFVQLQTGSPLAEAVRSLRSAGFDGLIFAAPGLTSPSTLELLSPDDTSGAYTTGLLLDADDPAVASYVEAYEEKLGERPDIFSAVMYDAVRMIGEAVAAGATTPQDVAAALDSMTYQGITAQLQADEEGNLSHSVNVLQFDEDQTTALVATHDLDFTPRGG